MNQDRNYAYKILIIILIIVVILSNTIVVFEDVEFTYGQFIDDDALDKLDWVKNNLVQSDETIVFVINGKEETITPYIDYWRQVIGSYVPTALVYVGKTDKLLKLKPPDFANTQLQVFATKYFIELGNVISNNEQLRNTTIVIIDDFYQPITRLDIEYNLEQKNEGIYVINNYSPRGGILLIGSLDYWFFSGPWYGIPRNWSLTGMVLETYENLTVNDKVAYQFKIDSAMNYTLNISVFDVSSGYVPVAVKIDGDSIGTFIYEGSFSPRTISFSLFLAAGVHSIFIGPANDGILFLDLDYIEILERGSDHENYLGR